MTHVVFTPATQRWRFYNDGTENGSVAINAQNTNSTINVAGGNADLLIRLGIQETGGGAGASTDDWQLQVNKNSAGFANVTAASANVQGFNSGNLTDGGATTERLTGGTGSFVAGEVSEDGLVDDHALTASNYTEHLYAIRLISADLADGDLLDFQVLLNGATIVNTVVPRITVSKPPFNASRGMTANIGDGFNA